MNLQQQIAQFIPRLKEQQQLVADLSDESKNLHLQLRELERKRRAAIVTGPSWSEDLLKPLLQYAVSKIPGWYWLPEELPRQVLPAEITIFFYREGLPKGEDILAPANSVYLIFYSGDIQKAEIFFKTRYPLTLKKTPSIKRAFRTSKEAILI